jgi:HJR/Mrr/RecB family endonuclease
MKKDIEELLKTASYVIGYMHGMNKSLEELSYDSNYLVQSSYFYDIWQVLNHELNAMLQLYPDGWMNLNVYQDLAFNIEAFFNQMGVVLLENDKKEVYFKVM